MKIGIGIDTGGTCTDAVVYDFAEKKVLASAKSLTTKQDLAVGIENSLNKLPEELLRKAEVVALSTTLATNACVEGKGGKAAFCKHFPLSGTFSLSFTSSFPESSLI